MNKSKSKSKKADKSSHVKEESGTNDSKSGGAGAGSGDGGGAPPGGSVQSSPHGGRPSPSAWFTTEIQQMMHGFGDCKKPLQESAAVVEEIVHRQMTKLICDAVEVAVTRNARFLSMEDFLFLMRKDKVKLRRLIRYLTVKDAKASALKGSLDEEENAEGTGESKPPPKKKRKLCYDFLSAIDQTGELLSIFEDDTLDEVKHERALRAELMSRHMDAQQYLEFSEARQASFSPRYKSQRFRDWLFVGLNLDLKPNVLAMEVLSYLAYETIAQIVDLALLVKRDMNAQSNDPFAQLLPAVVENHDPSLGLLRGSTTTAGAGLKSPSRAGSPGASPPSTPTTPNPGPTTPGSTPTSTTPQGSQGSAKAKAKKRKKVGPGGWRELHTADAITPAEIREAFRRYSTTIGPFADFSKTPLVPSSKKLFCT